MILILKTNLRSSSIYHKCCIDVTKGLFIFCIQCITYAYIIINLEMHLDIQEQVTRGHNTVAEGCVLYRVVAPLHLHTHIHRHSQCLECAFPHFLTTGTALQNDGRDCKDEKRNKAKLRPISAPRLIKNL